MKLQRSQGGVHLWILSSFILFFNLRLFSAIFQNPMEQSHRLSGKGTKMMVPSVHIIPRALCLWIPLILSQDPPHSTSDCLLVCLYSLCLTQNVNSWSSSGNVGFLWLISCSVAGKHSDLFSVSPGPLLLFLRSLILWSSSLSVSVVVIGRDDRHIADRLPYHCSTTQPAHNTKQLREAAAASQRPVLVVCFLG